MYTASMHVTGSSMTGGSMAVACSVSWTSAQVVWNAEKLGAGIHFNTAVWWRGHVSCPSTTMLHMVTANFEMPLTYEWCAVQMIKYGVIGTQLLYDDLQHWDSLYIAGRMQKPVLMLKDYAKLPLARKNNLDAAFITALLLLPERFTLQVIFQGMQVKGCAGTDLMMQSQAL